MDSDVTVRIAHIGQGVTSLTNMLVVDYFSKTKAVGRLTTNVVPAIAWLSNVIHYLAKRQLLLQVYIYCHSLNTQFIRPIVLLLRIPFFRYTQLRHWVFIAQFHQALLVQLTTGPRR